MRGSIVPEAAPGSETFNKMFAGIALDLFPPTFKQDRERCPGFLAICP